jgi:hypothetical protein
MSEKSMKEMFEKDKAVQKTAEAFQRGAEANDAAEKTPEDAASTEDTKQMREDYLVPETGTEEQTPSDTELARYEGTESSGASKEKGQEYLSAMKKRLQELDEKGAQSTLKPGEDLPDHLK